MKHLLNEEQEKNFLGRIGKMYKQFKAENKWGGEQNYKEGIVDFCDALIFVSSEITYDISHLRTEVEYLLDEIDNEEPNGKDPDETIDLGLGNLENEWDDEVDNEENK